MEENWHIETFFGNHVGHLGLGLESTGYQKIQEINFDESANFPVFENFSWIHYYVKQVTVAFLSSMLSNIHYASVQIGIATS